MTDERAMLTADELAAELYRRQGFLVVNHSLRVQVGSILPAANGQRVGVMSVPLRVIGLSNESEANHQHALAISIYGGPVGYGVVWQKPFFYRVEAAD